MHSLEKAGRESVQALYCLFIYERSVFMEEIINAISTVGFPIVAYGAMFWYMIQLNNAHKEEMNSVKSAIESNTRALIELKALVKYLTGHTEDDQYDAEGN